MEERYSRFLSGMFLLAFAALTYEVALSYEFAYIFWFNASIAILSIAMLGLGIGGVVGYFVQDGSPTGYSRVLAKSTLGFGVSLFLVQPLLAWGSRLHMDRVFTPATFEYFRDFGLEISVVVPIILFSVMAALPFVLAGIGLSVGLNYPTTDKRSISYIYFSDLLGAGMGSFALSMFLQFISLEATLVVAAMIALGASVLFIQRPERSDLRTPVILGALMLLIFTLYPGTFSPAVSEFKPLSRQVDEGGRVISWKWSPVSRIDVIEKEGRYWMVENGVTPVEISHGNVRSSSVVKDPRYFMFEVTKDPPDNMLAIGAGGGVELTMALRAGVEDIRAAEINPLVVDYMVNDFYDYSRGLFFDPRISVILEDGRTYVNRYQGRFDLIENGVVGGVGLVVPSSRVLNFVYTYVFTEEANMDYWDHLEDGGVALTIIYVLLDEYNSVDAQNGVSYHLLRQYSTITSALEKAGVDPEKHMMIFLYYPNGESGPSHYQGEYTFVFKEELTQARVEDLIEKGGSYDLKVAVAPYYPDSLDLEGYLRMIPSNRSAGTVTDDRPFFFHTERGHPDILTILLVILGVLTIAFIILPVALSKGLGRGYRGAYSLLLYFFCLGMGYILIEAVIIQKLTLFLGRPAYAFQVVLFSMLVFSGMGSFFTSRLGETGLKERTPLLSLGVFLGVILYIVVLDWAVYGFMHHVIWLKALLTVGLLAPLAFLMGMPFPTGLRLTCQSCEADVVWMYAVNAAGSVVGSLIGMIIAFNMGYTASFMAGGTVYLIGAGALYLSQRP